MAVHLFLLLTTGGVRLSYIDVSSSCAANNAVLSGALFMRTVLKRHFHLPVV